MTEKKNIPEDLLLIGDKIDVVSEDGQVYRSMVEDRLDDGPFLISVPHRRGRYMYVAQDDILYVVFYRESGRYIAQMKVLALEKRGAIRYMWLVQETKAQKNQRREAYRLPVSIGVVVYELDEEETTNIDFQSEELVPVEAVISRNISIKGIAISSKNVYTVGDKYILGIDLDDALQVRGGKVINNITPILLLKAVVRRCVPINDTKSNHIGLNFLDITKEKNEQIARYVLLEQQRQIKGRRGML